LSSSSRIIYQAIYDKETKKYTIDKPNGIAYYDIQIFGVNVKPNSSSPEPEFYPLQYNIASTQIPTDIYDPFIPPNFENTTSNTTFLGKYTTVQIFQDKQFIYSVYKSGELQQVLKTPYDGSNYFSRNIQYANIISQNIDGVVQFNTLTNTKVQFQNVGTSFTIDPLSQDTIYKLDFLKAISTSPTS
jgi:hypothetical protein